MLTCSGGPYSTDCAQGAVGESCGLLIDWRHDGRWAHEVERLRSSVGGQTKDNTGASTTVKGVKRKLKDEMKSAVSVTLSHL